MNILLYGPVACQGLSALRDHFGDRAAITAIETEDPGSLDPAMFAAADVMVSVAFDHGLPATPRLRLLQLPASGLDAVDLAAVPERCAVCNVFEHDIGISDYVLAAMLHFTVDLAGRSERFRAGSWPRARVFRARSDPSSPARPSAASAMARSPARWRAGRGHSACRSSR